MNDEDFQEGFSTTRGQLGCSLCLRLFDLDWSFFSSQLEYLEEVIIVGYPGVFWSRNCFGLRSFCQNSQGHDLATVLASASNQLVPRNNSRILGATKSSLRISSNRDTLKNMTHGEPLTLQELQTLHQELVSSHQQLRNEHVPRLGWVRGWMRPFCSILFVT